MIWWQELIREIAGYLLGAGGIVAVALPLYLSSRKKANSPEEAKTTTAEAQKQAVEAEAIRVGVPVEKTLLQMIAEQSSDFDAKLESMASKHTDEINQLKSEHSEAMTKLHEMHKAEIQSMRKGYEKLYTYVWQLREQITRMNHTPLDWPLDIMPTIISFPTEGEDK